MGCSTSIHIERPVQKRLTIPPLRSSQKLSTRKSLMTVRLQSINEKYQIIRALGSDTIGTLFLANEIQSDCLRTLREISKHSLSKAYESLSEFTILSQLDHPNIIKIFEVYETIKNFYIVLENISGGTLLNKFKKVGFEAEIARFAHELFSALNYLHGLGFVHSNVCSEHVILSSTGDDAVVKLTGFLSARQARAVKEMDWTRVDFEFCSPETLRARICEKSDVWSAGVLLFILLTTKSPFPRGDLNETLEAILKGAVEYSNSGFNSISKPGQSLIRSMFIVDPNQRPSFEELLKHPWFSESKQTLPITYNIAKKLSVFHIKSHITRCFLNYIISKLSSSKKDFTIIKYFKSLDLNNDGKVSKEEILTTFQQVGLNVLTEIDFIMKNLDYDSSGFIDYTELILAMTNWSEELKVKNLVKVFLNTDGFISVKDLFDILSEVSAEDLIKLKKSCLEEKGLVSVRNLKKFLKTQVVFI